MRSTTCSHHLCHCSLHHIAQAHTVVHCSQWRKMSVCPIKSLVKIFAIMATTSDACARSFWARQMSSTSKMAKKKSEREKNNKYNRGLHTLGCDLKAGQLQNHTNGWKGSNQLPNHSAIHKWRTYAGKVREVLRIYEHLTQHYQL